MSRCINTNTDIDIGMASPMSRHVEGGQVMEWFDEECRFRATAATGFGHGPRGLIPEPTTRAYLADLLRLDYRGRDVIF